MIQHTPLPWTLQRAARGWDGGRGDSICADSQVLARVTGFGYPFGTGQHPASDANAEYIVKACNNYPAMLEALRDVAAAPMYRGNFSEALMSMRDKAREVLAAIDGDAAVSA